MKGKKMYKTNYLFICAVAFFCFFTNIQAADTGESSNTSIDIQSDTKKIQISGIAAIQEAEWVHSNYKQHIAAYRPWIHLAIGQLRLEAHISEHLRIIVNPEVRLWFDTYPQSENANEQNYPFREHSYVSLAEAQGILSYGDIEKFELQFSGGVIPYKYNQDVRNLGEYLFRSGTRPPYIETSFDYAFSRLSGFCLKTTILKNLTIDALLTTETRVDPTLDWSLSFLAGYKFSSILDIGAGINFDRLLLISSLLENPIIGSNSYLTSTGEQKYFSFGGTKLMGRVGIDPKGILPSSITNILGKEDCKLYAEAAVLGVKNTIPYKWYKVNPIDTDSLLVEDSSKIFYTDIKKRIPIMFGFNVPTFKLFDYFSMEFEWYGWDYPNSTSGGLNFNVAVPVPNTITGFNKDVYELEDNWKFSLNAQKTLTEGFSIIGQIARDHTRHVVYYEAYRNEDEVFTFKHDWGWWLKLKYSF